MANKVEELVVNGDTVSPGNTREYRHEFDQSGVLTDLKISTYTGQQFDLQYTVYTIKDGNINYLTQNIGDTEWLGGNGDVYLFDTREEFEQGDELVIEVENTDSSSEAYDYTVNIRLTADYEGVGGVLTRWL